MKTISHILAKLSNSLRLDTLHFATSLPDEIELDDDLWDVSAFNRHPGKRTIRFDRINNLELRCLCKACLVEARSTRSIGIATMKLRRDSFSYLSRAIGERTALSLNANDFINTEQIIRDSSGLSAGTSDRQTSDLAATARWFSRQLGLRIEYHPSPRSMKSYGRFGSDEGRAEKLIPDTVIADILALRILPDLELRDRFFLNLFSIAVATGFRINELFSLPADCLLYDEGALKIINYESKGGQCAPRPIAPEFVEMVTTCVTEIQNITDGPRALASKLDNSTQLDWDRLLDHGDAKATDAAMRQWAKKWISTPHHRMLDRNMGYSRQHNQWFEIDRLYESLGSAVQVSKFLNIGRTLVARLLAETAASKQGVLFVRNGRPVCAKAFETDPRVCSLHAFVKDTHIDWKRIRHNPIVNDVLRQAMEAQIFQQPWSQIENTTELLNPFQRLPLINLSCHKTGDVRLYARDALCTIYRNQLTTTRTYEDHVQTCTSKMFSHWLSGLTRSQGNKSREDSLFSRFNILDPRTNEIAKLTSHDLRHWLTTAYEEGGLSQEQMSIVFNRKSVQSNATYTHTSAADRSSRLREAIREGTILGQHADTFIRLAKESPEDAEMQLAASTKFFNPMPHGLCTLNMVLDVCPHSLSCFSYTDGEESGKACEHLIVDPDDISQQKEIKRINTNAESIINFFEIDQMTHAPQYTHYKSVKASTDGFLKRMKLK